MTTPTASPAGLGTTTPSGPTLPSAGASTIAPRIRPRLYTLGATAAAAKRPFALSALVAIEPSARKIGLRSMIRVSSIVRSRRIPAQPGVIAGTISGAATNATTASTSSATSISDVTVDTIRQARASSSVANSPDTIGMSAELSAPAATSWKIRSGSRKAAKKLSRLWPASNVVAIAIPRT